MITGDISKGQTSLHAVNLVMRSASRRSRARQGHGEIVRLSPLVGGYVTSARPNRNNTQRRVTDRPGIEPVFGLTQFHGGGSAHVQHIRVAQSAHARGVVAQGVVHQVRQPGRHHGLGLRRGPIEPDAAVAAIHAQDRHRHERLVEALPKVHAVLCEDPIRARSVQ
ncbi:MAG: hypothetical protein MZV64_00310 [Ignavibacteriales bacterium]|nr:hypothetical protein [Ignavibacteriales bacterium]